MKKFIKNLIFISLLSLVAFAHIGCKNNDDDTGPAPSADPIISTTDLETLTESANLSADISNGDWIFQRLETTTKFSIWLQDYEYKTIYDSLTNDEKIAAANWFESDSWGEYKVTFDVTKDVHSTTIYASMSNGGVNVNAATAAEEITVSDPLKKKIINKYAEANHGNYNWDEDTGFLGMTLPGYAIQGLDEEIIDMLEHSGSINWSTNSDKTMFYAKYEYSNEVSEYLIVKK